MDPGGAPAPPECSCCVHEPAGTATPVVRHQWLFEKQWVEELWEELQEEELDFKKRDERIGQKRTEALREVWDSSGYEGILGLCELGDAAYVVGWHLADDVIGKAGAEEVLYRLASELAQRSPFRIDSCISGFLAKFSDTARDALLSALVRRFSKDNERGDDKKIRLLRCAPFATRTWRHVNKLPKDLIRRYWTEVLPRWTRPDRNELHTIIDRLLDVDRPRAAFSVVRLDFKEIESKSLVRLLKVMATNGTESAGHYPLKSYSISQALKVLDSRVDVSRDEIAQLEFIYLGALDHDERGIPNLERQIAESPALFVQAVGLTYKRSDNGQDPPEWRPRGVEAAASIATQTYRLLHKIKHTPGTREDGTIDAAKLKAWIKEVRALCKTYGRELPGDHCIGELLAKSAVGPDGIWPCVAVRDALEETGTKEITDGMAIGVHNARGVHWRGEGGQQERDLSAKYRGWSKQVAFDSPFASRLLEQIAQSYDSEAAWQDTEASIRKRLMY